MLDVLSAKKTFAAEIKNIQKIALDTYEVELKIKEPGFSFIAGQYIWLVIPEGRRAFSVCSSPGSVSIKVAFRDSSSKFKKALLKLPLGSMVNLEGSFGYLSLPEEERSVVFIAGGVGITPFLSMIRFAFEQKSPQKIVLLYENSSLEKAAYLKELEGLQSNNPNFHFYHKIGQLSWQEITEQTKNLAKPIWYVVGPKPMCEDVGNLLLEQGVKLEDLKFEEFYVTGIKKEGKAATLDDLAGLEKFRVTVENSSNHIILTDTDGHIQFANHAAEKITGYSFTEMKGQTPRLWGGLMDKSFYEAFWKTIKYEQKPMVGEIKNRRKNGQIYVALARVSPIIYEGNLVGFIGTEEDITEHKMAEEALKHKSEELEQANNKLQELDQMKDDFVSLASHELRTPMTAIEGFADMILEGRYGPVNPELKEPLTYITESTERLIGLVNDMLDVSRIEQDRLTFTLTDVSLKELISEVVATLHPLAVKKGITLGIEDMGNIMVKADLDKLKQILNNLIGNSIKFTDQGSIVISAMDGKMVKVFISDTGMGITVEDIPKLFGKFQQISSQQVGKPAGTGLGLYFSRELVRKMGGELWLEKSKITKGSTFAFSLPSSRAIRG